MDAAAPAGSGLAPREAGPGIYSGYLQQIDALRLLAVLVVMFHHYLVEVHFTIFGRGVELFFMLSGYFTTRQLLLFKDRVRSGGGGMGRALAAFYARRYIRILPVYAAVVAAGLLAGMPEARDNAVWLATFTANWGILLRGEWIGPYSHFWSLAVLEQFYLFWPTLVLTLPRRWETRAPVVLVLAAVGWRTGCLATGLHGMGTFLVPWAGWDQLGIGALVAVLHARGDAAAPLMRRLARVGLLLGGPVALGLLFPGVLPVPVGYFYGVRPLVDSLFFAWLVDAAARGFGGLPGRILSNRAVCTLGRSSYSIFAIHHFTVYLLPPGVRAWLGPVLDCDWRWTVLVPATLLVAWLCYRFVERPIGRLKRHFTV